MPASLVHRLALAGAPAILVCALAAPPAAAFPQVAAALPEAGATAVVVAPAAVPGPETRGPAARAGDQGLEVVPTSWVSEVRASSLAEPERAPLVGAGLAVAGLMGAFVVGLSRRPEPVD